MHHFRSIRRVALSAALAGAAIGALPAMAGAASTCAYDAPLKQVFVTEDEPSGVLGIRRLGNAIAIQDSFGSLRVCANGGSDLEPPTQATVFNTDRINVKSKHPDTRTYTIDQSAGEFGPGATPESDGISEIETVVSGERPVLQMIGTAGRDLVRIGPQGINFGLDNFGTDNDVDIRAILRPEKIVIVGRGGDDILSGNGILNSVAARVRLVLDGGDGHDFLRGGLGTDDLLGRAGNDELVSDDGVFDILTGGPNFDTAVTDAFDSVAFNDIESRTTGGVGRLRLAPRVLRVRAGKTARLRMSWTHPKAWRQLRKIELRLHAGIRSVGTIAVRPAGERLTAPRAVKLMAEGSRVTHRGKTVTAKLAMRLPKSLAGADLRVDVRAIDRRGRQQTERGAGTIRVVK